MIGLSISARLMQDGGHFPHRYTQLSLQRAIHKAKNDRQEGVSYREACDAAYLQVRGPALLKLGFEPTAEGLAEYMDCREPKDDLSSLDDELCARDPARDSRPRCGFTRPRRLDGRAHISPRAAHGRRYVPLMDAHNRIVALMAGNSPAKIQDARSDAARAAWQPTKHAAEQAKKGAA